MAIEQSHGKARPALTRASDLQTTESAAKPTEGRTPDGRFMAGNRASLGARFTATIKKSLGTKGRDGRTGARRLAFPFRCSLRAFSVRPSRRLSRTGYVGAKGVGEGRAETEAGLLPNRFGADHSESASGDVPPRNGEPASLSVRGVFGGLSRRAAA